MKHTSRIPVRLGFYMGNPLYEELLALEGDTSAIRSKIYTFIDLGFQQYKRLQEIDSEEFRKIKNSINSQNINLHHATVVSNQLAVDFTSSGGSKMNTSKGELNEGGFESFSLEFIERAD